MFSFHTHIKNSLDYSICPVFITVRGVKMSLSVYLPFYTGFCAFESVRQGRKDVFLLPDNGRILKISQAKSPEIHNISMFSHLGNGHNGNNPLCWGLMRIK